MPQRADQAAWRAVVEDVAAQDAASVAAGAEVAGEKPSEPVTAEQVVAAKRWSGGRLPLSGGLHSEGRMLEASSDLCHGVRREDLREG